MKMMIKTLFDKYYFAQIISIISLYLENDCLEKINYEYFCPDY